MAKSITVIPATKNLHTGIPVCATRRRRVAGYARVSTDSEEQLTSYEAQVDYYTHYIQANPEWQFVDVYTDEGISATNTKKRDGFNRMIPRISINAPFGSVTVSSRVTTTALRLT